MKAGLTIAAASGGTGVTGTTAGAEGAGPIDAAPGPAGPGAPREGVDRRATARREVRGGMEAGEIAAMQGQAEAIAGRTTGRAPRRPRLHRWS
jgi:hypothetical protein